MDTELLATIDALSPPSAPLPTFDVLVRDLAAFPRGDARTRTSRARTYLNETRGWTEQRFREGTAGMSTCRLLTEALDRLVIAVYEEMAAELQAPPGLCLAALGGYGRRQQAAHSDVDLLLLIPQRQTRAQLEATKRFSTAFNTFLWDCKLTVGWAVRTAEECAKAAEEDHTVRTALLDCRRLCGDPETYEHLTQSVLRDLLSHRADDFVADKAAELSTRRQKYGDSLYVLEPNVKNGEGGLRDLEAALWIAQARFRTRGLTELLARAVLPESEVKELKAARDFLLRCRHFLHFSHGRKEDRLTFESQEQVAEFLGYRENDSGLAVEQFMRHFYLSAACIRRAADALIARCEEVSRATSPLISALKPQRRFGVFKEFRGRLTVDGGPEVLREEPANILRMFRVADEQGMQIYSWAAAQVRAALPILRQRMADPEVLRELKLLLTRPETNGDFLFPLHDLGVLGAVLPEFGRITALHQHDIYHVYTVDVHSIFALKRLYTLRRGELDEIEPLLAGAMRELEHPLPLYLGMLLHDAGKGMGGDHSIRGDELAQQVSARLGLPGAQEDVLRFLVRQHLLMSRTSQRRDLSDPELIEEFARLCGHEEKLTALTLLTYADIHSVGPNMWTDWKRRLLHELFLGARAWLMGNTRGAGQEQLRELQAHFRSQWSKILGEEQARALETALPARYFLGTDPDRAWKHARLLRRIPKEPLAATLQARREAGLSELSIAAPDRPGLLATMAGVLSAHRIDILGARIFSTDDGRALDTFEVRGPLGQPLERPRWHAARADLVRVLRGETTVQAVLKSKTHVGLGGRPLPKVPTKINFDNRASTRFTVVDVRAADRMGLLYQVAQSLHDFGVEIGSSRISTEGHRAVDSFYVARSGAKLTDEDATALCVQIASVLEAPPPAQ